MRIWLRHPAPEMGRRLIMARIDVEQHEEAHGETEVGVHLGGENAQNADRPGQDPCSADAGFALNARQRAERC